MAGTNTEVTGTINNNRYKSNVIKIVIAHRGNNHYREMHDPKILLNFIKNHIKSHIKNNNDNNSSSSSSSSDYEFEIDLFDTSLASNNTPQKQINMISSYNVVICTHGAFETNVIYMNTKSLLIEITGTVDINYITNSLSYNHLANIFHVHYRKDYAKNLKGMRDKFYVLTNVEKTFITQYIAQYTNYKRGSNH